MPRDLSTKRPSRHPDMFGTPDRPRKKPQHRAHVCDAGDVGVQLECRRCGWVSEWLPVHYQNMGPRTDDTMTMTDAKRGIPCEVCNVVDQVKQS